MARKTKEEAEQTYHALLDAATTLFIRQGVARTTLNDIAQAVGMTRGAVYWHFDNKDAVIKALWERNAGSLIQDFNATLTHLDSARAREHFREAMKGFLRRAVSDPMLSQAMRIFTHCIEFTDEKTELQDYLFSRRDQFFYSLLDALRVLHRQGALRPGLSPEVATTAVWAYLNGLVHTHLEPGTQTVDLLQHGDTLMDLLLEGILSSQA